MNIVSNFWIFLRLIRFKNILIIYLTQFLCFWKLTGGFVWYNQIYASSLLSAAAGYLINDFYDQKIDRINKKQPILIDLFGEKSALLVYFLFVFLAVWLQKEIFLAFLVFFTNFLLWFYAYFLKKKAFFGNFLVALFTAWSVFFCMLWLKKYPNVLLFFAFFAFLLNLIREIIKDIEDIAGDKTENCRTLPIVLGVNFSKKIIALLFVLLSLVLWVFVFEKALFFGVFWLFFGVFFLKKLYFSSQKQDFSKLSAFAKYMMLAGLGLLFLL